MAEVGTAAQEQTVFGQKTVSAKHTVVVKQTAVVVPSPVVEQTTAWYLLKATLRVFISSHPQKYKCLLII